MLKPVTASLLALGAICASSPALADDAVAQFYRGKTVTVLAGGAPGGGYMGNPVEPLFFGRTRPTHDMTKFHYIGNANKDFYVCLIRADAPVKTFAEAFEKEVVVGATAEGASTRDFPTLLKNLLGAKFKVVSGYRGTHEINLAIERNEVH